MGELNTKRKIRDNAVRAMGFIVSSNDALDEKDARSFWIGRFSGSGRGTDTRTCSPPRFIWTRARRTRTSGLPQSSAARTATIACAPKELFAPDKRRKNADGKWEVTAQGTMSRLQEDFWEQVAKPYGYERPLRHELRAKGYRSLDAYKVQVGTTRALKSEIETLEGARTRRSTGR